MAGNVKFGDVVTSVRKEAELMTIQGVNKIIALGHAGFTVDKAVAKIPDVDVVVGGHTNTFLYTGNHVTVRPRDTSRHWGDSESL